MIEIHNIDYNNHVDLVGTAHFTRRSLNDAVTTVTSLQPSDIALELDVRRFRSLNNSCIGCPRRGSCQGVCEFIGATIALGNVDANVWLIDMTELEMRRRMSRNMTPSEWSRLGYMNHQGNEVNPVWLWERGFKEQVVENSRRQIEHSRKYFPSVWRVLIDERNALMAARLAWIISEKRERGQDANVLAFVGAAHVDGIKELLKDPRLIQQSLKRFDLSFTEPTLMRRVAIQGN